MGVEDGGYCGECQKSIGSHGRLHCQSLRVASLLLSQACTILRPVCGDGPGGDLRKGLLGGAARGALGHGPPPFRASLRRCDAPARPVFSVTSTGCAQAESGHSGGAHAGAGGAGQRIEGARYAQCGDFAYLVLIAALQLRQAMLRAIYGRSASMVAAGFV